MLLTEIEKQSFCCNSDCLFRALRNLFASFCWLIPPLLAKSTKPCSSTYLSYKDSFIISTTSCTPHKLYINETASKLIIKFKCSFTLHAHKKIASCVSYLDPKSLRPDNSNNSPNNI